MPESKMFPVFFLLIREFERREQFASHCVIHIFLSVFTLIGESPEQKKLRRGGC